MKDLIPARLSALGHPQRLDIFRLLMRRYPDRVPAGEIAAALDLPASTLSAYLSSLVQVGLLERERQGTSMRYAVAMEGVQDMFDRLLGECCRGRPELCLPPAAPRASAAALRDAGEAPAPRGRVRTLFLCTGNSARSIFAECLLRDIAGDRFDACSAGTDPQPAPHPLALATLRAHGHDVSGLNPTPVAALQGADAPGFDLVITLCDQAANAPGPSLPGRPIAGHWGVADPARSDPDQADPAQTAPARAAARTARAAAFERAYAALSRRIRALAALPVETLDRLALQAAIDEIARSGGDA